MIYLWLIPAFLAGAVFAVVVLGWMLDKPLKAVGEILSGFSRRF